MFDDANAVLAVRKPENKACWCVVIVAGTNDRAGRGPWRSSTRKKVKPATAAVVATVEAEEERVVVVVMLLLLLLLLLVRY